MKTYTVAMRDIELQMEVSAVSRDEAVAQARKELERMWQKLTVNPADVDWPDSWWEEPIPLVGMRNYGCAQEVVIHETEETSTPSQVAPATVAT